MLTKLKFHKIKISNQIATFVALFCLYEHCSKARARGVMAIEGLFHDRGDLRVNIWPYTKMRKMAFSIVQLWIILGKIHRYNNLITWRPLKLTKTPWISNQKLSFIKRVSMTFDLTAPHPMEHVSIIGCVTTCV